MNANAMIEIWRERSAGRLKYGARLPDGRILDEGVTLAEARKIARAAAGRWSVTHQGIRPGIVETWRMREAATDAIPACAASMGCLCAGHARGNPAADACDTSEKA